jgi:carbamoyltransferase
MTMKEAILGISVYYHDSAAALLIDGKIAAAAQEERFTRTKHDSRFPLHACQYALEEAGLDYNDLQAVAFYDKPFLKFERLLETYHAFAPSGVWSFATAIPVWIREKLFMKRCSPSSCRPLGDAKVPIHSGQRNVGRFP